MNGEWVPASVRYPPDVFTKTDLACPQCAPGRSSETGASKNGLPLNYPGGMLGQAALLLTWSNPCRLLFTLPKKSAGNPGALSCGFLEETETPAPRPCQQEAGIAQPLRSRQQEPQSHHDPGQGVEREAEAGEERALPCQRNGVAYEKRRPAEGLIDSQEEYSCEKPGAECDGFRLVCPVRHGCVATPGSFFSER